ncbi:MAG: twin-arginine translocase TatA/TatE family subunit [bacterium]|nr:twin-arginine translocase TatA/TatE family subunit [bacterium]
MPGWSEILIIAFVGLLLFGRRLPEVGRSVGKAIVEFKKGVRDVESDIDTASRPNHSANRALPPAQSHVTPELTDPQPVTKQPEPPPVD